MKLFKQVKDFTEKMNIFDFLILKICLLSSGVMLGASIPSKYSKRLFKFSFISFITTYCILTTKFVSILMRDKKF
ncbi:MAG: hypothetical protein ACRDA4_09345 [Filifactoraceae bacterium]